MNAEVIKQWIVDHVTSVNGCKATELATIPEIAMELYNSKLKLSDLILELVSQHKLVEVEYILPNLDFRIKSFLLPAKTKVTVCL